VPSEDALARKLGSLWPHLNERQRRLLAAAEARELGRGGIAAVCRAVGISRPTVEAGLRELEEAPGGPPARSRRPGGGRKKVVDADPRIVADLEALVEPTAIGDPMSPLRWTTKSTRTLAAELAEQGHVASYKRVGEILHALDYSLQANAKVLEGTQHPDRDAQFRHINDKVRRFHHTGDPVISVDTKKKELVGAYKNAGSSWRPKGDPEEVLVHDFRDPAVPKAIPYGIYDPKRNEGWVSVGADHDTATFAVETFRRWWKAVGSPSYPRARRLLICADAGGSNGYRLRLWKLELSRLATEIGIPITVCHFPPGTSKWNRIEHRLFSQISMNWRGQPLTSYEVIVDLIGATTTRTGLSVHAELDRGSYPKGVKITKAEFDAEVKTHLVPDAFHGEWNYTIKPEKAGITKP
jgi:transposase